MVDTLYSYELLKDYENWRKLKGHIALWAKENGIPPNILSTLIQIEKDQIKKKTKEEKYQLQKTAEENIH